MATKAKASNTAVVTFEGFGAKISKAYLDGLSGIANAEKTLAVAKSGMLGFLKGACEGLPALNGDTFDAKLKDDVKAGLVASGKYKAESVGPVLSRIKVAVLAIANDIDAPEASNLNEFVQEVTPALKAKGLYASKTGASGNKSSKPRQTGSSDKLSARQQALQLLLGSDRAEWELLDGCLKNHKKALIAFMATLAK